MSTIEVHAKFMRIAIRLSEQNVIHAVGGPFGAVLVKDGILIAKSANTVTLKNDPTAHAEVSVIRQACKKLSTYDLTGCVIYTSCEPCSMCLSAIYWARIDTIFYANAKENAASIGFDDQFIYDEINLDKGSRKLKMQQILSVEADYAFELWKQSESKKKY